MDVPEGAVYDGSTKRRQVVAFDTTLREAVSGVAREMHRLFRAGVTPPPVLKKACHGCSLKERCFPEALGAMRSVDLYYREFLKEGRD